MSNQRSYYQPKFLREIQLGLVVYGGVSLAIYTHGVCQEFFHAVRGRGIYKLVKALVDADLVVDTISGSSAGGIDGILLAYAIANSNDREIVDFSSFARIWRNSGDLLKLLRKPNIFKSPVSSPNFGRDSFYHRELLAASMRGVEYKLPRSRQEWFSPTKELDLAVAATDYLGKTASTPEQVGTKNHQALFLLKHRQGRKEPFNPYFSDPQLPRTPNDTYQALVKLCQITAGTPVIFPLVEVDLHDPHNLVDRQLVTWGKLAKNYSSVEISAERSDKLYFLDGGLLDNSPLTCLQKAAYYRLPSRGSNRRLFYIDPNPENLNERLKANGKKQSRTGKILQAAALSLPIHQSIANDLRAINEHNHKVRRYQSLIDRTETSLESQHILEDSDRTQSHIYLRGRLFDFRDRNLPLLLKLELSSQNSHYSVVLDKIERILTSKFTNGQDRQNYYKLLNRFEPQVIDLDVEYSVRQHFYIIERIADLIVVETDSETRENLQCLSNQLSCNIKLLEVIRTSIELLLSDRAVNNYFYYLINQESNDRRLRALVYELMFRLHRFMLDATRFQTFVPVNNSGVNLETIPVYFWLDLPEIAAQSGRARWLSQSRISSVFAQLKQRIAEIQQSTDLHRLIWMDPQLEDGRDRDRNFPSILKQISIAAEVTIDKWGDRHAETLRKQWHTFEIIDRELYPFEYLTSLHEKEIINPISIGPDSAQLGIGRGKNTHEKLGGDKLYNIGGFFKKSWKSNDLLWGRLDGLNRIVEGVVTPKSVAAFADFIQREVIHTNSSPSQYIDWLISESLPHLAGAERQTIERHLQRLAQPGLRIERAELQKILSDLVLAGQKEILTSDVHSAIEGVDDQPGWWRLAVDNQQLADNLIAKVGDPNSLPTPNPNSIVRIVHQSLANLAIQQKNFFRNQYRISVDKLWDNMPLVTLIGFCTKIVLFLRNLLVRVFQISASSRKLRHPLYRLLDGILQSNYWWLQGGNIELGAPHRRARIILFQLLGITTALGGLLLACLFLPLWLLLSLPGTIVRWLLQTMRLKRLTSPKDVSFLPKAGE